MNGCEDAVRTSRPQGTQNAQESKRKKEEGTMVELMVYGRSASPEYANGIEEERVSCDVHLAKAMKHHHSCERSSRILKRAPKKKKEADDNSIPEIASMIQ